jgi:hypothetical protein
MTPLTRKSHRPIRLLSLILLSLLALQHQALMSVSAQSEGATYVPAASEVSRLLAPMSIVTSEEVNDGWDASAGFTALVNTERGFDLFASARVLPSEAESRGFFDDVAAAVTTENERTSASKSAEVADRLSADESWEIRLIYDDPDLRARQSDYARLLRFGRVVILLESIGDPALDDLGKVDEVRESSINRLSELIAGKVAFYPVDGGRPIPALEPFATQWATHGVSLDVDTTGHGELTWRIYRWCSDDPTPPCDRLQSSEIDPGGGAAIAFTRVDGQTAHGFVIGSTDTTRTAIGPVTMTIDGNGMAQLRQIGQPSVLCGPDFARLAPHAVQDEHPCGA